MEALSYCQLMERCLAAEARVVELAAENVALKAAFHPSDIPSEWTDVFGDTAVIEHDAAGDNQGHSVCWSWVGNQEEVIKSVLRAVDSGVKTPATDRIVAAQRSAFVDEAVAKITESGALTFGDCIVALCQLREGTK